jgi:hypothetical protein
VKRRRVLLAAGALATGGLVRTATARKPAPITAKIWLTEGAAAHPRSRERAADYLRQAVGGAGVPIEVAFGETTIRPGNRSDKAIERRFWPQRVLEGRLGLSSIDPVRDINLLVTDGEVHRTTAGYAYPHIAAVPGSEYLAQMEPPDEAPGVVPYTVRSAVTQLLLHEVGHALGLDHHHGEVDVDDTTVTVSPMVSGYAWSEEAHRPGDLEGGACKAAVPAAGRRRRLAMTYSGCAQRALRSDRKGLLG